MRPWLQPRQCLRGFSVAAFSQRTERRHDSGVQSGEEPVGV
jgi:hypothetical protein